MSETPDAARGRPTGVLLSGIDRRAKDGFTGVLRAEGPASGVVVLREGRVVAAATPAAPGPESLLLRSGRVSDADWTAAFAEGAPHGRLAEALVARGAVGSAGVQILAATALADAVFALALRGVHTCAAEPLDAAATGGLLFLSPGLTGDDIVGETLRRLTEAAEWQPLGLTPAAIPARASDAHAADPVLAAVNGRRTVRDLAFALGKGLFVTMRGVADLLESGAVTLSPPARDAAEPTGQPGELPKRLRGASDVVRVLPFRPDR
ncbi:hypothetical protein [Actinocorallia sp. A-T 12471]|uniref:hypothetical protein n=1 Tax=Actinocorallia sp. A-T 12471 TaxID=3089813 RepID=UPI0029D0A59F|nr:hypothetical protein [Actinocorallia sp. A-T 12471]MDX6739152.1 hypothetical protein [Actinocorallia sp. A-T 12471]